MFCFSVAYSDKIFEAATAKFLGLQIDRNINWKNTLNGLSPNLFQPALP
jgi:hypothetical protein